MNSMLATDANDSAATAKTLLESHHSNERMRHIPPLEWLVNKLEGDVRRRVDMLLVVHHTLHHDDVRRADLEGPLRALCRAIERVADAVRHGRNNHHAPQELGAHLVWSIEHAAAALRTLDPELFGRRYPFHAFERSRGESVYGALIVALMALDRAIIIGRAIDPTLDEKLYAHLVSLEEPLRREPIA